MKAVEARRRRAASPVHDLEAGTDSGRRFRTTFTVRETRDVSTRVDVPAVR
jgi:hypothetical protein